MTSSNDVAASVQQQQEKRDGACENAKEKGK